MTPYILLALAAVIAGLRVAYQAGKAEGFIEGLQVIEESECGQMIGRDDGKGDL